jgi:hypothetical protein
VTRVLTEVRLSEGLPLEEVARRHWPANAPGIAAADGADVLSDGDRSFFRSLRPRGLTAVILCIDR